MARSQNGEDSVYDFFYVDANRIGVLLSQFGSEGILTELVRSVTDTSEGGGGFDIKVVKGDTKETAQTGLTRRFDPRWLIPIMFLRDAQDMLERDIAKATVGQLVLVGGTLSMLDASMLPKIYSSKSQNDYQLKLTIDASMEDWKQNSPDAKLPTAQRRAAEKKFREHATALTRTAIETFPVFSFGPQFLIEKDGVSTWGALRQDGLTSTPEDIFLTHGTKIPGTWYAVGLLDAEPSPIEPMTPIKAEAVKEIQNLGPTVTNQANLWRARIGRPAGSYGITTLLIFREVQRNRPDAKG